MSERKYRQRGYQDDERRERSQAGRPQPEAERPPREMRPPNLPGFRQVLRCARCGNMITGDVHADTRCSRCGADLHACAQCVCFDPSARFECTQPISARISPKDARNDCPSFSPRTTVERETGSTAPVSARQAFDDLFK